MACAANHPAAAVNTVTWAIAGISAPRGQHMLIIAALIRACRTRSADSVGFLDGGAARFGKTYAGEIEELVRDLKDDEAVAAADTLLLTIPNQLGVDYNLHVLESVVKHVAPALGWR